LNEYACLEKVEGCRFYMKKASTMDDLKKNNFLALNEKDFCLNGI
jgi:hypothetical protein